MGFHSNIIKRSNKPSSASKLRTDADNSGQRPLIEEDRLRLGNHDTTLQSHADALTSHDTRINTAQSRASATLPKDGSEPMTGYPDLPSIDPTGNLKPIKKVQLDRVRSGQDLNAHATDDTLRAITALHQKTNSTNDRVLASSATDGVATADEAARAVTARHQKTNSTDARVLQSHPTDDSLRAITPDAIRTAAVTGPKVARGAITGGINAAGTAPIGPLALDTVVSANILPGEVGPRAIWDNLQSALLNDYYSDQLRRIGGSTGVAYTASSSDHFHSISFKHLTEEAQDAAIALREKLRAPGVALNEVRDMVLILCHLLFDDPEETFEEHKERRKQGKKRDGEREDLHDYGARDKEGKPIMEHRRRGRFGRENHPDISKHIRKSV